MTRRRRQRTTPPTPDTSRDEGARALARRDASNAARAAALQRRTASEGGGSDEDLGSRAHSQYVLGVARGLDETETPIDAHLPVGVGAGGAAARQVQERLVAHGAAIEVDGAFGPRTQDMVRAFQVANGLGVDGQVTALTAALLFSEQARGIDAARLDGVPGVHIGQFETFDEGRSTGMADVVVMDGVRLAAWVAPHWERMRDAASADGVELRFNSLRSGFRTPEQQEGLYARYGSPRAVPSGWSNHQSGHAIDLVMEPAVESWMSARAGEFGFVRPTYEDWHWEYRG